MRPSPCCQMAHATCLAAARNAVLAEVGWNVEEAGLAGAPAIRVLAEVAWNKTEPVGVIEMTIVDDGRLWLSALTSSFITCSL